MSIIVERYHTSMIALTAKILIIILCFTTLHFVLQFLFKKFLNKAKGRKKYWQQGFFETCKLPALIILWLFALSLIAVALANSYDLDEFIPTLLQIRTFLIIVALSWFALQWKGRVQLLILKEKRSSILAAEKVKIDLIGKIATLFIIILATIFGLEAMGFNVQTLATIGGISGFSLGFACKDIIANFFGGLMLYITRPFVVGENIKAAEKNLEGSVEEISWYYTCIRGIDKQPIYVPNSLFSNILVTNLSRMSHWNIDEVISIRYKDISLVEPLVKEIKELLINHPAIDTTQPVRVHLDKFSENSIDIGIWVCTFAVLKDEVIPIKQQILLKIANIVSSMNAEFASPVRTIEITEPIQIKTLNPP